MRLLETETKNLIKKNLTLAYQSVVMKTHQNEYVRLIKEQEQSEKTFLDTFKAAHEFLESQTL